MVQCAEVNRCMHAGDWRWGKGRVEGIQVARTVGRDVALRLLLKPVEEFVGG